MPEIGRKLDQPARGRRKSGSTSKGQEEIWANQQGAGGGHRIDQQSKQVKAGQRATEERENCTIENCWKFSLLLILLQSTHRFIARRQKYERLNYNLQRLLGNSNLCSYILSIWAPFSMHVYRSSQVLSRWTQKTGRYYCEKYYSRPATYYRYTMQIPWI